MLGIGTRRPLKTYVILQTGMTEFAEEKRYQSDFYEEEGTLVGSLSMATSFLDLND